MQNSSINAAALYARAKRAEGKRAKRRKTIGAIVIAMLMLYAFGLAGRSDYEAKTFKRVSAMEVTNGR